MKILISSSMYTK